MKKHWFSFVVIAIALGNLALIRHCAEQHHVRFGGFIGAEQASP